MREIVLSSPGRKNALSTPVLEKLAQDLAAAGGEPVLLTGAGDVFSAGLDLREVAELDLEGVRRLIGAMDRAAEALFTYRGPTVALVNGHAIAGGCVLALCCDWRVTVNDPGARIGLNEVALGLMFPPRCLAVVRAQLGLPAAERAVLGAALVDPAGALEAGLVDEVAGDARAAALARLEMLSRHPPAAYATAKAAMRAGVLQFSPGELEGIDAEMLPRWASPETREAARRALQRR